MRVRVKPLRVKIPTAPCVVYITWVRPQMGTHLHNVHYVGASPDGAFPVFPRSGTWAILPEMVEAQGFVNLIREDCRGVGWQSYEEEALWSKHQAEGR
jgi:hypothetical protein